ncbi:hypothetical protein STSP_00020 [Streptomyces jeddahensis]|uniref:Uncharacterized protein n=1 Tax=Streptomyces jeddahensis TaxID=1716141 RepID=A0A177I108_9ACTN|nr:hypothetical protein STSP_00020 [Streptomyces jeddahensis]
MNFAVTALEILPTSSQLGTTTMSGMELEASTAPSFSP